MAEANWRRRYRAASLSLPSWARLAPERLLYTSNGSGKTEVYAWDRAAGSQREVTDRPEGTTRAALEPPGERIWWFDDDRGSEHGVWRVEPFAGGPSEPAAPNLPAAYGAGLALARGFAVIGSSDDGGTRIHRAAGSVSELLYEHPESATVAGLARDESLLAIEHSEHGDSRHPAVRVLDLSGRPLAELWDGPGRGLGAGAWSPVEGDQRLLVVHERTGLSRPSVWSPPAADVRELSYELPGDVSAAWYPDARALLLSHDHRGRSELYRYDLETDTLHPLETEPGTIGGARVRADGELWYSFSSGARPPSVMRDREVLLQPPGEPAPAGRPYRDLQVGPVHGFLVEPEGPPPHPTLFLVHGGPQAHDRDAFSARVQAWVDHGFAVALVNYRGSSGYGREWRDALERSPGLTELEDILAVREHLVAGGVARPQPIVLSGGSWGGYLTLLGLGTQPEAWDLGIAIVPVADSVAEYEDEMEPLKAYDRALFGGSPAERPDFYQERSPITYVQRVRVPVLILAGRNDPRCPIRQIENYLRRLQELGKPNEFYEFAAGHSSLVTDEQIRQMEAQLDFAHRHVGTPAPL